MDLPFRGSDLQTQLLNVLWETLEPLEIYSLELHYEQIEFRDRRLVIYYVTVQSFDFGVPCVRIASWSIVYAKIELNAPDSLEQVVEWVKRLSATDYPDRVSR